MLPRVKAKGTPAVGSVAVDHLYLIFVFPSEAANSKSEAYELAPWRQLQGDETGVPVLIVDSKCLL